MCQWRLDDADRTICSWGYGSHDDINDAMSCLIGDVIDNIEVYPPFWDAVLTFASGKVIRIFCDAVDESVVSHNWSFETIDTSYFLGIHNKFKIRPRDRVRHDCSPVDPATIRFGQ